MYWIYAPDTLDSLEYSLNLILPDNAWFIELWVNVNCPSWMSNFCEGDVVPIPNLLFNISNLDCAVNPGVLNVKLFVLRNIFSLPSSISNLASFPTKIFKTSFDVSEM